MEKFLKVVGIEEVKTAKNGREYVNVTFRPTSTNAAGVAVLSNQKPVSRILWAAFTDKEGREFQADALFTSVKTKELGLGTLVEGEIVRRNTTEYEIGGKKVSHYTGIVFSGESDVAYFNSQLKANKACVLDDDGNPTVDMDSFKEVVTAS